MFLHYSHCAKAKSHNRKYYDGTLHHRFVCVFSHDNIIYSTWVQLLFCCNIFHQCSKWFQKRNQPGVKWVTLQVDDRLKCGIITTSRGAACHCAVWPVWRLSNRNAFPLFCLSCSYLLLPETNESWSSFISWSRVKIINREATLYW